MRFSWKFLMVLGALGAFGCAAVRSERIVLLPSPVERSVEVIAEPDILPTRTIPFSGISSVVQIAHASDGVENTPAVRCDVLDVIRRAPDLLASASASLGTKKYTYYEQRGGRRVKFTKREATVPLLLLNESSCSTSVVMIQKRGAELVAPDGWDIHVVTRANGIEWNDWNTEYDVSAPSGWFAVANRWPFEESRRVAQTVKTKAGKRVTTYVTKTVERSIVYTPYSEHLRRPEIIAAGRQFLAETVQAARSELAAARVMSRAYPGTLVADVDLFAPEVFERLILMEHTDWQEFLLSPQWTTDRLLATIGANRERFASATCNSAGACGIAQFTDRNGNGTYSTIVRAYPEAKLISTFTVGAANPVNSVKAAILLHDNNLASLHASSYGEKISRDERLEEFLAALYNASRRSVERGLRTAVTNPAAEWSTKLLTETKQYIQKLRWLRGELPPVATAAHP